MKVTIFSLFPHWFDQPLGDSIIQRAREAGRLCIDVVNYRDYAEDRHATVDDAPYGGGGGMVLRADVLARALDKTIGPPGAPGRPRVFHLSPRGRTFTQETAIRLSRMPAFALLCGHYEAIDQRLLDSRVDEEISLGDFVLTGGEIPAMAVVDAVARMIPGVLGNEASAANESFMNGLLEAPHYTRPEEFEGKPVPEVLLSGNHAAIDEWREEQSLALTRRSRPDLYERQFLHPRQIRRIARRGRPIIVWHGTRTEPIELAFASKAALDLGDWTKIAPGLHAEQGLSQFVWYGEVKDAYGPDAETDRKKMTGEVATALAREERPGSTRSAALVFLRNLYRALQLEN